ncbi:right-handed parallel beta-helix repeat-containing protein, partial [Frankia sp. AvcI1]
MDGLGLAGADPAAATLLVTAGVAELADCDIVGGRVEIAGGSAHLRGCRIAGADLAGLHVLGDGRATLTGCVVESVAGTGVVAAGEAVVDLVDSR